MIGPLYDPVEADVSETEYESVLNTARLVLGLLNGGEVPPVPSAYEAVFDAIKDDGPAIDEAAVTRQAAERMARDAEQQVRALLLTRDLESGLRAVNETLAGAVAANARYAASLDSASAEMERITQSPAALRTVVGTIIAETMRLQRTNKDLSRRINAAGHKLTALRAEIDETRRGAGIDALTRIANRRHFDLRVGPMLANARAVAEPLSVVLFDVDHFRRFNDRYGHQMGDHVLRAVARVLHDMTGPDDLVARFGGEEFIAVLSGRGLDAAEAFATALRDRFAAHDIAPLHGESQDERITASYGVATMADDDDPASLIERADRCLYAAKQGGRDRIVLESDGVHAPLAPAAPEAEKDDSQSLLDLLAAID